MGFVMDGLDAEAYDRTYGDRVLIGRIWQYFRVRMPIMITVAIMVVLNAGLDVVLPLMISRGIDIVGHDPHLSAVSMLMVGILLAGALSWLSNFGRQWYTARAIGDVVLQVRLDAFKAVMTRDMSFYDEFPSGKIVSRVTSDTEDFANVVTLVLNFISQGLLVLFISVVLLIINPGLAGLTLLITPVIVGVALAFRRLARTITQRARRSLAKVNNTVQETISGISVAKNFRQEEKIYDEFKGVNQQSYAVNLRQGFLFVGLFPLLNTIAGIGTAIVVFFGSQRVLDGQLSPGSWYLFVQAIAIFWFPLTSIASFWSQFQQGLSSSERIFALIDAEPRVIQKNNHLVARLKGAIDFKDVIFRYTEQQNVLNSFNLSIPAGQTLAIVGHTGAGKSTLAKLIARFYEFQEGQILIDGQDIRTFDLQSYRQQLGIVPQTPFLFSGTVRDNIRYGHPNASDDEVTAAANGISNGEWLTTLPQGLETEVGEEGKGLSMGQRQIVVLARVLLQDPAIIILDEATASIDPLTEAEIQEGLETVLAGRTAILIAHRLSTIENADRIIVMRLGEIVEEGNHIGLLEHGGHYANLYNTYFRSQALDYVPGGGFVPVRFSELNLTDA